MAVSDAHKRASKKWNDSRDNIMIRPSKEEGQRIRTAASAAGKSVQAFILDCCRAHIDNAPRVTPAPAPPPPGRDSTAPETTPPALAVSFISCTLNPGQRGEGERGGIIGG